MGVIGRLLKTKIETFILNTIEKRFGYNVDGEAYAPPGIDAVGIEDDRVYLAKTDGQGNMVVLGTLNKSQGAESGEIIIFSRDSNGNLKGQAYFKKDGDIEINGDGNIVLQNGSDFAVRHDELKAQIDQLKQDFDNFVTITYNTHNHPTAPVGPVSPPSNTGTSSTADFNNIKVDNINLPAVGE